MINGLLLALVLALATAAGQTWRLHSLHTEIAEERMEAATEVARNEALARVAQATVDNKARSAVNVYLQRAQAARVAAAGTDAALRGVLNALAAATGAPEDPVAACRTSAERVRVLSGLLAEGASLVAEGQERVGRLDAKLTGLQSHTVAVTPP